MAITATAQESISAIKVEGTQRMSVDTVRSYVSIHPGQRYSTNVVDDSVKRLFATGFFSDVNIIKQGSTLVVEVSENPLINKIAFEGNKRIKDEDLRKELGMTERGVYSGTQLQNDIQRILAAYHRQGRYATQVTPKLINLDQNRVNLVYEIDEGKKSLISRIAFVGNERFSDQRLQKVLASKESTWYRFFSSVDVYDRDRMLFDQELLRIFYMERGFADFEILSARAELAPDQNSFLLTFVVHEGGEYNYGPIKVASKVADIEIEKLQNLLPIKAGEIFNVSDLERAVDILTTYLGDHGYAFVDVTYTLDKDKDKKIVAVTFIINETYKVYLNRINIKNNIRTLDKVIRREFRIAEGDPYNTSKIQRSKQRLQKLGFFKNVEFHNVRTSDPDRLDIDVEVEETSTGSINFGAGYNTVDGPLGMIALTESNFLGKGQQVDISLSRAKRAVDLSLGFTEPYFIGLPLAAGFDLFSISKDRVRESSYKLRSTGGVLRFGYEITEHLYHGLRYNLRRENIFDISDDASLFIKSQAGKNSVSSVGHTLSYDKLDDNLDPHKGFLLRLNQDLAGLGGQTHYFENKLSAAYYHPIYKDDVILGLSAKAGYIMPWKGDNVRLADRFFVGSDEIRGFATSGIGPRDKNRLDALGGRTFYSATAEVSFPLGLPQELSVRGVVFADAGSLFGLDLKPGESRSDVLYDKSLRSSYGAGIIWNSALGRLRFDYGRPVSKQSYDKVEHFRFFIGTNF